MTHELDLWRWRWRELWQGQLWPIVLALVLIVSSVFALSALTERIERLLVNQSRSAMAGDLVLSSSTPIDEKVWQTAQALGLNATEQVRFNTMLFFGDEMTLVTVKSVTEVFPLRGQLQLQGDATQVSPNGIWLPSSLFQRLKVKNGDSITLGDAELVIRGEVSQDPEWSFNPFHERAVVFIHREDLSRTGAVQFGSRVYYRGYFTGASHALAEFRENIALTDHQKWFDETTPSRTGDWLLKTRQYLSITLMMVVLMASVTLFLTFNHYSLCRRETVAMMKSLGASRAFLWQWLSGQLGMLLGLGIGLGWLCGMALEVTIRLPLQDLLPDTLDGFGGMPFFVSGLVALLVALPALGIPLWRLVHSPSIAVIQIAHRTPVKRAVYGLLLPPLLALAIWFNTQWLLWGVVLLLALLLAVLAGIGILAVRGLKKWAVIGPFSLALQRIERQPFATGAQLSALSASLMLVAVIALLRTALLDDWASTVPQDAPNVFAINLANDEKASYLRALDQHAVSRSTAYPIFRGRLVANNGESFDESIHKDDEALRRELSLTWQTHLPSRNVLTAGEWNRTGQVSVEALVAQRLGIQLGDTLTFSVYGQTIHADVSSFREVEWRNMQPNFYFIFSPDVLTHLSATWLVSFRIEDKDESFLMDLSRAYPTVSVLDLRSLVGRVQNMLGQLASALSILAWLSVVCGLLLMITLLKLNLRQRMDELRLYRILGASRWQLAQTLWFEYGTMALLAGGMAAIGAQGLVSLVMVAGFSLPMTLFGSVLWLPVLAAVLVWLVVQNSLRRLTQI